MTVSYTKQFGTVDWCDFFHFARLLGRWRGGFYKLVLPQLLVFSILYAALISCYSLVFTEAQERFFENVISVITRNSDELGSAVAFFLGFFIDQVLTRFWRQYHLLPWADGFAFHCAAHLTGRDQRSRLMRRTLVRYVCAATVIGLCEVDPRLRRRFPTFQYYVDADLLTAGEATIAEQVPNGFSKHYVPLSWATALLRRARVEGRIADEHGLAALNEQIDKIRGQLGVLQAYEWVPVPLVYIHVVVLAVYASFTFTVMTHPFEKFKSSQGAVFSKYGQEGTTDELHDYTRIIMRCMVSSTLSLNIVLDKRYQCGTVVGIK